MDGWTTNGLALTALKIVNDANNQDYVFDEHGMLFRKYLPLSDTYGDEQLKIINSTIAITNDNWETVKTAVGAHYYIDPLTNVLTYAYGINGETIIGKIILGEQLGIYNSGATLQFNKNGLTVTNDTTTFTLNPNTTSNILSVKVNDTDVLRVSKDGLYITGEIVAQSGTIDGTTTINGSCIKTGTIDTDRLNVANIITVGGIATNDGLSNGTTTIDGSCIKTGTIDTDRLNVANIITVGGIATTDDIPTNAEITTITKNTITTSYVNALKVTAAAITIKNPSGYVLLNASGNTVNIGSFTVGRNSSRAYLYSNSHSSLSDTSYSGVYIGDDGISIYGQGGTHYMKLDVSNSNFEFKGKITATSGTFSGTLSGATGSFSGSITATSGYIGNWSINSTYIGSSQTGGSFYITSASDTSNYWIRAHNAASGGGSRTFSVSKNGELYASGATISGYIEATSGTIGDFTISSGVNGLYSSDMKIVYDRIIFSPNSNEISIAYASNMSTSGKAGIWIDGNIGIGKSLVMSNGNSIYISGKRTPNMAQIEVQTTTLKTRYLLFYCGILVGISDSEYSGVTNYSSSTYSG